MKLSAYGEEVIPAVGTCELHVKWEDNVENGLFVIVLDNTTLL